MKVIIICNNFPPINSISSDRPFSWYLYFKQFGIYPIVITKNWLSDGSTNFNKISKEIKIEHTENGTIIRTPECLTPSLFWVNKFEKKYSIIRKFLTYFEKTLSFLTLRFDQHKEIYKEAVKFIDNSKVDCVITTGGPFILFRYGYLLTKKYSINWIADYRDGWYLNHTTNLNRNILIRFSRKYELFFEKRYTRKASFITTVDPEMSNRLKQLTKKRTEIVYNGFWKYAKDSTARNNNKLILNHTGTLTKGQRVEYLLETLVNLVSKHNVNEEDIEINFIGLNYFPIQAKRVNNFHESLNHIIKTTDRISKDEATDRNLQADFLLNFTDPLISAIYAKTYDYIACKREVLVIPDDNALLGNIILENKLGFTFKSKTKLEKFLIDAIKNKQKGLLNSSTNPNKKIDFFLRSNQAKIFTNHIKK